MPIVTAPNIIDAVIADFARTTDEVFTLEELKRRLRSGKQLCMKYGVDVTAPNLHIGHAVNLWMYRTLQELGHKVIFLIGDFTTQIGDPTGKNKTRPVLPLEEIQANANAFIEQAFMVLHRDEEVVDVRRNSEWLESMDAKDLLSLLSMITHTRLISRDMFQRRLQDQEDIYMHELVYPILQGYDSVALKSDLTVIGSDQLFNEMVGRTYQEKFDQPAQVIITTKITPGTDGKHKQSKSLNNYIGLGHTPREKFGRIMSIPDRLIIQYFEVYTDLPEGELARLRNLMPDDPFACKLLLAEKIVARYHGDVIASQEREWFIKTFSERQAPADAPVVKLTSTDQTAFGVLRALLDQSVSNRELRRLFLQGGIRVDDVVVKNVDQILNLPATVKVGKRKWFRVEPQ
jgi:tyrosyl-tRNA synthetase